MIRLGVLTTHPIQYQVPWFRRLSGEAGVDLTVLYCLLPDARQQGDGFGVDFQWDIPLLEGYRYRVLRNVSRKASVTAFSGCDTPGIRGVLRDERFEALIVNGWVVKSCLQALAACHVERIPCLVRGESNSLRSRPIHKQLAHRVLLRQYAACLAIGKLNRDFYLANGVPESRIFMTPYGVDNAWFARESESRRARRGEIRRTWGIPADAFVFLFSGKLIPKKRPADIVKALAEVGRRSLPPAPCHLLVAGDGGMKDECERMARVLNVPATFAGFLNQRDMPDAYAASDCLVLPSDNGETWGLVVNEAMASGLPAIVSDQVGCHPDLIVPGRTGFVFPCGDVTALARCLGAMASDPRMCRDMGQAAQACVEACSVEAVVDGVMAALRHVKSERVAR